MLERIALPRAEALLLPAALVAFLVGCDGSVGNRLSGTVTFDGKPVPAGKVFISPDASKGATGHTGWADIKDGKFDTDQGGQGVPTGAVVISVEGYDPKSSGGPQGGEDSTMKSLFRKYEVMVELPEGESTQDIQVPKEAEKSNIAPELFIPNDV